MNWEEFFASLKAGEISKCYLFEGEEEYTKESALSQLRSKVLQGEFASLNETVLIDPSAADLIAYGETLPFLADRRLVLVRESAWFSQGRGAKDEEKAGKTDGSADEVADYLENLPDSLCLVFFVRGKANATRKLYKRIQKLGGVVSFDPLDQRTLIKWITQEMRRYGKQVERQVAEQLVFAAGRDMHVLSQEIAKLAAGSGEAPSVTAADIESLTFKTSEYKVFDLSDAVVAGNAAKALSLLQDMLAGGEQRLMLLSLLQRQYRQLLFTKILLTDRQSQDAIARVLAVPPFVARRLMGAVRSYGNQELLDACQMLTDTEYLVKSGQMPEEGSLEDAVLHLLAARREDKRA